MAVLQGLRRGQPDGEYMETPRNTGLGMQGVEVW